LSENLKPINIALIAGNGNLPLEILETIKDCSIENFQVENVVVVGFKGQTDPSPYKDITLFSIGHIGEVLNFFKQNLVTHIIMAGGLKRPSITDLSLDMVGAKWLKSLGWKAFRGDNDLLSGIMSLLQGEGFQILSLDVIKKSIMATDGVLTTAKPIQQDWEDINRGVEILNVLSPMDVGQAVIVQQGIVLGIEAKEGTEELIKRCKGYMVIDNLQEGSAGAISPASSGVLIKIAKIGQDNRVDLPTIGTQTIEQVKATNLRGIAISAGTTQIIDKEQTIELANQLGIFIVGLK